jgi:two-component system response regulator HydG
MGIRFLVVDDEESIRSLCVTVANGLGFTCMEASNGQAALSLLEEQPAHIILTDLVMPQMSGIEFLDRVRKMLPRAEVAVMTGHGSVETAVQAMKLGAYDYITKPLIPDEVVSILNNLLQKPVESGATDSRTRSVDSSQEDGPISSDNDFFEGQSPAARALYAQVRIVAGTNYSIILYGESGTGKEVIARTIHNMSQRSDKPFVAMDCGTLSKELAGSELFGHVKGAFTGALQDKVGHFELANGGTLFLDEVGNLSVEVQATLLRVIQERKIRRVGGNKEMEVDVRLIVASNENLQEAYRKGKFREDLYHRFNEFSINLPPLRSRREDIIPLTEFFLSRAKAEINKEIAGIDDGVLQIFQQYSWPGNLREFRNVIRRAVLLTKPGGKVTSETMPWEICGTNAAPYPDANQDIKMTTTSTATIPPVDLSEEKDIHREAAGKSEYETIMSVLQQVNFNKKKAAELLKIDRKTLYNKIKNFQPINKV